MRHPDAGLPIPFAVDLEVVHVVQVCYRNACGTRSAVVVTTASRLVVCEHGARREALTYSDAFSMSYTPTFCPACMALRST